MLSLNEARVWILRARQIRSPDWAQACQSVLVQEERLRLETFARACDRRNYLLARGLTRFALSDCLPAVAPQDWRFRQTAHGRPELAQPTTPTPLRFNISHTQDLIAVIVCGPECGIDVERIDRQIDVSALSAHVLSFNEQAQLSELPNGYRSAAFFSYWTLKEAYTKALGLGLSVPFESVEFNLWPSPAIRTPTASAHGAGYWQFEQWFATSEHLLALAIRQVDRSTRHTITLHDNPPVPSQRAVPRHHLQ